MSTIMETEGEKIRKYTQQSYHSGVQPMSGLYKVNKQITVNI